MRKLGIHPIDLFVFLFFALVYTVFGVIWTTGHGDYMAGDTNPLHSLQTKKDIMYYLLWICAMGYAVIANTIILWPRLRRRSGIIAFVVGLGVIVAVFFGMTLLTGVLNKSIPASTKILSIAVSDLLVLLPVVTSTILFVIALVLAGIYNHHQGQPVVHGFVRLGIGLMLMPLIQFLVIFFLPRWDDEVRGVVFIHAMGLGLMWGLFLGGGIGANMLRRTEGAPVAASA
jgi:hypothetical protein